MVCFVVFRQMVNDGFRRIILMKEDGKSDSILTLFQTFDYCEKQIHYLHADRTFRHCLSTFIDQVLGIF